TINHQNNRILELENQNAQHQETINRQQETVNRQNNRIQDQQILIQNYEIEIQSTDFENLFAAACLLLFFFEYNKLHHANSPQLLPPYNPVKPPVPSNSCGGDYQN
ncbi:hypothetical protein BpHYR1_046335, partial [Brachionus plicatilis]